MCLFTKVRFIDFVIPASFRVADYSHIYSQFTISKSPSRSAPLIPHHCYQLNFIPGSRKILRRKGEISP